MAVPRAASHMSHAHGLRHATNASEDLFQERDNTSHDTHTQGSGPLGSWLCGVAVSRARPRSVSTTSLLYPSHSGFLRESLSMHSRRRLLGIQASVPLSCAMSYCKQSSGQRLCASALRASGYGKGAASQGNLIQHPLPATSPVALQDPFVLLCPNAGAGCVHSVGL